MFELLNRVKNKIFNTLGGAAQTAGNFAQQSFNRTPVGMGVNTIAQAAPRIQESIQRIIPTPQIRSTANDWWQDQLSRPAVPQLQSLFPEAPTLGEAGNTAREWFVQFPARAGAEALMTVIGERGNRKAQDFNQPGLAKFAFGDQPLQNWFDPNRPGQEFVRKHGLNENLALPLIAGSAALDASPLGGIKKAVTKAGKQALKKGVGKTLVKELDENRIVAQEYLEKTRPPVAQVDELTDEQLAMKMLEDSRTGVAQGENLTDEQLALNYLKNNRKGAEPPPPPPPKKTEELFQGGKGGARGRAPGAEDIPLVRKTEDELFSELVGKREAAKTTGIEVGSKFTHIPAKEGPDVIRALEDSNAQVSESAKGFAKGLREEFDRLFKEAKDTGIDIGYLKNYVTHIWDKPVEEVAEMYQKASKQFGFAKGRQYPTYEEGIKMGLKPKYTNPSQIIAEYVTRLEQAKADIRYLNQMKAQGYQVPANIGAGRWAAPAHTGNLGKAAEIGAKVSGVFQDIGMSGGVPKTPLNAWTFAQATKEILSGRIMSPLKALVRSSVGNSNEFFRQNLGQIKKMQERNIPVDTTLNVSSLADKGLLKNMFGESGAEAWNKVMNESTFKKFMPQLQIQLFNDIEKGLLKAGKSADEAADTAAQTVKNFYGITGTDVLAKRSELGKDILNTVFFAPRYRESMINFWTNIVKGLGNPLATQNKYNMRFAVGATMTLAAMNYLNEQTMGHGMWDNPKSHRDKLLIPVGDGNVIGIPFLSSIATMPRFAAKQVGNIIRGDFPEAVRETKTLLSFGLKPPVDVLTNENYFGQEIYDPSASGEEKAKDIGRHLFESYSHPYVRALSESGMFEPIFEKKDQPGYATISKALEAPIRFTTEKKIRAGYYFDEEDSNYKKLSSDKQGVYDTVFKQDESGLDETGVLRKNMSDAQLLLANPDVLAARTKIQIETAKKTGQPVDPFNLLTPQQQQMELQRKALPPGDETKASLTSANIEWMKPYWTARAAYFDEMTKKGIITPKDSDVETSMVTPPEIQQKLDTYYSLPYGTGERTAFLEANPDLGVYWDEKREFTNRQRALLGLPPIEDKGFAFGGKGGGRGGGQTEAKIRAKMRSLNSLFNKRSKSSRPVKMPEAPSLKLPSLAKSSVKRRTKTSKLWFDA